MQNRVTGCVFVLLWVVSCVTSACAERILQSGDRWPQNAARSLAVDMSHVYLGRGNELVILNRELARVESIDLSSEILGIHRAGDHIYAAAGRRGLIVIDVSTPAAPAIKASYAPAANAGVGAVFVSGNYACITTLSNLFEVVDITDPADPRKIGGATLPGLLVHAANLFVSDGTAAITDQVNGLHLLDVSDPQQPVLKSVFPLPGAWDVALSSGYAYVTSTSQGMTVVQISSDDPIRRGTLTLEGSRFSGIALSGDAVLLADEINGLHRLDISDPDQPSIVQTFEGIQGGAYSAAISGDDIFVCDYTLGLQKIASDRHYPTPAGADGLFVDEGLYMYVVDSRQGLRILDVFNLGHFVFKGFAAIPGQPRAVHAAGEFAYIAAGAGGLQIVDVAGRKEDGIFTPVIVGALGTAGGALDVHVAGDVGYVGEEGGLRIVDVSNKQGPVGRGFFETGSTVSGVVLYDGLIYAAAGSEGLIVIDPSNPEQPVLVRSIAVSGPALDVAVSGHYAYVTTGAGLRIVDMADPSYPVVGAFDTPGDASGISLWGDFAVIADGRQGVLTLDVSDPSAPSKVTEWSGATRGTALSTLSIGSYVFVAEDLAGAAVYSLSDRSPFTPAPYNPSGGNTCFIQTLLGP